MIAVFAENITPRLEYVLDFCFKSKGFKYRFFTEKTDWQKVNEYRINYSDRPLEAELQISPSRLLFETAIRHPFELQQDLKIDNKDDPFALIFFLLARYEEYWPADRDQHDRYVSSQSQLVKLNLHREPLVDIKVKEIWNKIGLNYMPVKDGFEFVPTFDIDIAWAYKHRSAIRRIGAFMKASDKNRRIKVALGKENDPYDTYSYIHDIAARVNRIICFILLGDWSKYDKNIHWKNENYQSLIRGLNTTGGIGIHPSYNSYLDKKKISKEIKRLEEITGHEILKSRQHFLRLKFPDTYEVLRKCGIKRDFSMGFPDETGFRAGTCFPHLFFNLKENNTKDFKIFPFIYMDNALKDRLGNTPEESVELIEDLMKKVKDVGGIFICIWHNSSINDKGEWQGWRDVLERTILMAGNQ